MVSVIPSCTDTSRGAGVFVLGVINIMRFFVRVAAGLVIRHQRLSDEARERFDAAWNEMSEQERDAFVRRVGDRIMGDANER